MTMIEKAARGLWRADPENYGTEDAMWSSYVDMARAVLLAVRQPDSNLAYAATEMHDTYWGYEANGDPTGPIATFSAIIDAILEEPK